MSLEGKLAVANVVLNRVKSPSFPNTVYDVIFQKGQFPPAYKSGFKELVPRTSVLLRQKWLWRVSTTLGTVCISITGRLLQEAVLFIKNRR